MAVQDKNLLKHGLLMLPETGVYGSGGGLPLTAGTDGVLPYETPEANIDYGDLGEREGITGAGTSKLKPVTPSARKASFDLVHYFKGPLAAYTASVVSTVDAILQGFGMSATVDVTGGSEKWTYAPISTGLVALVAEVYARGQQTDLQGAWCTKIEISADGLTVPKWTANIMGIAPGIPVDSAVPTITYPNASSQNPKATNLAFTFISGGQTYTSRVRSFTFSCERENDERVDQNLANLLHAGFFNGVRNVAMEVVIEAATLTAADPWIASATLNPYGLFENEKDIALALNVGATQFNRFKILAPTARLTKAPSEDAEGNIATWGLSFDLLPSADGLEDDFTIVTD